MTRISAVYQGFKLGARIADKYALQVNVGDLNAIAGLHAIKNIANTQGLMAEIRTFGVNGSVYAEL